MNFNATSSSVRTTCIPLTGVTSLKDTCDLEFFKLDKNGEPINPKFYWAFEKWGVNQEGINFRELAEQLKVKPANELARMPLFQEMCDEYRDLVFVALNEVLINGTIEDRENGRMALFRSCQKRGLPESIRLEAKSLLLQFVKTMPSIEIAALPFFAEEFDEYTQLISNALQQALFSNPLQQALNDKICQKS